MNEELHSANEEMQTVNDELRLRSVELNEANAYLSSILSSLSAGVIVVDSELLVRVWNLWSEEAWGLRSDEVVGRNIFTLDFGVPIEELRSALLRLVAAPDHEVRTLEAMNRRGRAVTLRVALTSLRLADERLGVMLLLQEAQPGGPVLEPSSEPGPGRA
jgi:two-component system CheB/CheR fusion protein